MTCRHILDTIYHSSLKHAIIHMHIMQNNNNIEEFCAYVFQIISREKNKQTEIKNRIRREIISKHPLLPFQQQDFYFPQLRGGKKTRRAYYMHMLRVLRASASAILGLREFPTESSTGEYKLTHISSASLARTFVLFPLRGGNCAQDTLISAV